jgi:hypothetical protein
VARTTRSGIIVSKSQQQQRSRIRGARTRSTAPAKDAGPVAAGVRGYGGEEKALERGPEAPASSSGAKE